MKVNVFYFLMVGLLVGCSSNETPQSVTDSYLSLAQQGNESYADYVCMRDQSAPEIERWMTDMSSFQIQDMTVDGEGSFIAQVTGIRAGDEFSFKLSIRETEDLYQKAQDLVAEFNAKPLQTQELLQTSHAIASERDAIGDRPSLKSPERLDYSLKKFCVTESALMGEI